MRFMSVLLLLWSRTLSFPISIVQHLSSNYRVQRRAHDIAQEDVHVVNILQRRENTGGGAQKQTAACNHTEGARALVLKRLHDLRHPRRDRHGNISERHEFEDRNRKRGQAHQHQPAKQASNRRRAGRRLVRKPVHQHDDDGVLQNQHRKVPICRKRIAQAVVRREVVRVGESFDDQSQHGQAVTGLGRDDRYDLRELDDAGHDDNPKAEYQAQRRLCAGYVRQDYGRDIEERVWPPTRRRQVVTDKSGEQVHAGTYSGIGRGFGTVFRQERSWPQG
jgi:hypothetical protein